jgi:hypothetical protein
MLELKESGNGVVVPAPEKEGQGAEEPGLLHPKLLEPPNLFLRNVGYHSTHYTASYPRRRYSSKPPL